MMVKRRQRGRLGKVGNVWKEGMKIFFLREENVVREVCGFK